MKLSNWSYDGDTSAGGRYISVDDGIRAQRDFRMLSHEQFVNEGVLPTSNNQLYFHPHWLRHRDVIDGAPDWFISGIGIYIMVVGLAGIVGNIGVVSVFLRTPSLRTPSNYYAVNLAVSDASFSLTVGLMSVACFRRRWVWGQSACEWYAFVAALCGFNSIGTMALIAIDRYRFIARPFEMLYKTTSVRAVTKILAVWVWSVLCTCPPLLGWGRYIPEGFEVSCTFDYLTRTPANIAYNYALVSVGFILPVAILCGCYVGIIRSVFGQTRELIRHASSGSRPVSAAACESNALKNQIRQRRLQELHMAKTLAIMVSLFVASWLPYALIAQFGILGLSDLVTPYSAEIPVLLAKTSAVWNPVIYALAGWSKIYKEREQQRRRYRNWSSSTSSSCRHTVKMAASAGPRAESPVTDDALEEKPLPSKLTEIDALDSQRPSKIVYGSFTSSTVIGVSSNTLAVASNTGTVASTTVELPVTGDSVVGKASGSGSNDKEPPFASFNNADSKPKDTTAVLSERSTVVSLVHQQSM